MGQIVYPKFQGFDSDGEPLVGGLLHTYEAGTETPKTTYSDVALTTPNANPVVLDSRGEALVYGSGLYKLVLQDSESATIWTVDDVTIAGVSYIADADTDTMYQVEESTDEDIHRWDCAGEEQMTLADGVLAPSVDSDLNLGTSTKFFLQAFIDRYAITASYYATMPSNGVSANAKLMLGDSNTIIWMYLNTAPPGWKVLTTGQDSILGVKATARSSGTADSNETNKLKCSTATFQTDGVVVGDTAYNITDGTSALVTSVDSQIQLTLASDAFPDGDEDFEVGTKFVDPGGNQADAGSWTVDGITAATENSHTHTLSTSGSTLQGTVSNAIGLDSGNFVLVTSNGGSTYNRPTSTTGGGSAHAHAVSSDGKWRPAASIGRLFQLDTA